jgi:2-dehydropantoate 2-reductase
MRVIVLGAGAIGCWVGANLSRNGVSVMFVGRAPFVREMERNGLTVHLAGGGQWRLRHPVAATEISAEAAALADAVFICTKAYAVDEAIKQLQDTQLAKKAWVACFQNGLGSEERAAAAFGAQRILAATTTAAVSVTAPAEIRLENANGGFGIAAMDKSLWSRDMDAAAARLSNFLKAEIYTDYRAMKWSKLLLNLVGNASSAILDMPLRDMYKDKRLLNLEFRMLREAIAVMEKIPIKVLNLPGGEAAKLAEALGKYPDFVLRLALKGRFISGRGNKRPSLYADAAAQTGRSEVEFLNGQVYAWGKEVGVETPVNAGLTHVLLDLVHGRAKPDTWRGQVEKLLAACAAQHTQTAN